MRLIIIAGVVLGLLVVAPLFAATFEDGYRAFQEGDEDDAIEIWNEPGRKGDVQSQFALGFAYFHGTGTRVHSAKTFHWFKQAGEQGHASAQYYVGLMLERGQGTAQNFFRAAEWYDLAIRWGDRRDAKCALGLLYLRGRGLPRNEAKATKLIHAAAEQGHYLAQHLMGTAPGRGIGDNGTGQA